MKATLAPIVSVLVLTGCCLPQGKPGAIQATSIELVDEAGTIRGELKMIDGEPQLRLLRTDGSPGLIAGLTGETAKVQLTPTDDGPTVLVEADEKIAKVWTLESESGSNGIRLGAGADGPLLGLSSPGPTIILTAVADERSGLLLLDGDIVTGEVTINTDAEEGTIVLRDPGGGDRAVGLLMSDDNGGHVVVSNEKGRITGSMP